MVFNFGLLFGFVSKCFNFAISGQFTVVVAEHVVGISDGLSPGKVNGFLIIVLHIPVDMQVVFLDQLSRRSGKAPALAGLSCRLCLRFIHQKVLFISSQNLQE